MIHRSFTYCLLSTLPETHHSWVAGLRHPQTILWRIQHPPTDPSLYAQLIRDITLFVVFAGQQGIQGRSLFVNFSVFTLLYVPSASGALYLMAHAHVTYMANEWMKELTKKRQSIPHWMLSIVANIMKPDSNLVTRERLHIGVLTRRASWESAESY